MDKAVSLDGRRRQAGLTFRDAAGLVGITCGAAHRAIVDPAAHRGDAQQLGRAMKDRIRRNRSSDPELLAHVQDRAVPFLRGRQPRPIKLRRPLSHA